MRWRFGIRQIETHTVLRDHSRKILFNELDICDTDSDD